MTAHPLPGRTSPEPCSFCGFTGKFDGHVCEDHMPACGDPTGPHGLQVTDIPCPKCGETGHEVGMVLGLRAILCPNTPLGEIGAVDDR